MKKHSIKINRKLISIPTMLMGGIFVSIFFLEQGYELSSESSAGKWFYFGLGVLLVIIGGVIFVQAKKDEKVAVEKRQIHNLFVLIIVSILILGLAGTLVLLNN